MIAIGVSNENLSVLFACYQLHNLFYSLGVKFVEDVVKLQYGGHCGALLEELEPAYAITIHKSQGSEYPAVIIPMLSGPPQLLNRNLLYTAVTRAQKSVVILGQEETIHRMVDNDRVNMRHTGLADRIREVSA